MRLRGYKYSRLDGQVNRVQRTVDINAAKQSHASKRQAIRVAPCDNDLPARAALGTAGNEATVTPFWRGNADDIVAGSHLKYIPTDASTVTSSCPSNI